MKIGPAIAWGSEGRQAVPASSFHGTQVDARPVMAGGMEYEESHHPATIDRYRCNAITKKGEPCESWTVNESPYCQGHLQAMQKLEAKIAACTDEVERAMLEAEKTSKWL